MTLAVKKLPYHSHQLDLSKQENKTPEFLAISPLGMLPVLKDGDTIVRESQAIMFYLDRAYPSVPLYGDTPAEAGAIMQEICEQQSYADAALGPLIAALLFHRTIADADVRKATERFDVLLTEINTRLHATGWLRTHNLSAADINIYPPLRAVLGALRSQKAKDLGLKTPDMQRLSEIVSWMDRLAALIPDHARGS